MDLSALNIQRKLLVQARKVGSYVDEDTYLATKWSTKDINLSLVEMRDIADHIIFCN